MFGYISDTYSVWNTDGLLSLSIVIFSGTLESPDEFFFFIRDGWLHLQLLDFSSLAAVVLKSYASSSSLPIIVPFVDIVVLENSETYFGNSISHDSAVDVVLQTTTVIILEQAGSRTSGWANMAESM